MYYIKANYVSATPPPHLGSTPRRHRHRRRPRRPLEPPILAPRLAARRRRAHHVRPRAGRMDVAHLLDTHGSTRRETPLALPPLAPRRHRRRLHNNRRRRLLVHRPHPRHRLNLGTRHLGPLVGMGRPPHRRTHPALSLRRRPRAALKFRERMARQSAPPRSSPSSDSCTCPSSSSPWNGGSRCTRDQASSRPPTRVCRPTSSRRSR